MPLNLSSHLAPLEVGSPPSGPSIGSLSIPQGSSMSSGSAQSMTNLLTAGASMVHPLLGMGVNLVGNWLSNKQNEKMLRQQQEWNEKMWHMNNAYNTPKEQIRRLREASINPMLSMADVDTGTSSSPVSPTTPQPQIYDAQYSNIISLEQQKKQNEIAQQNADTQRMAVQADLPLKKAQSLNIEQQTKNLSEEFNNIIQTRKNLEADFQFRQLDIDKHETENLYYDLYGDDIMTSQVSLSLAEAHVKTEEVKYIQRRVNNETMQSLASMINANTSREFMKKQGELIQLRIDNFQTELDKIVADKKLSNNQAALIFKQYCNLEWQLGNEYMRTLIQGVSTGVDAYNASKGKKGNYPGVTPFENPYESSPYGFSKTW